MAKKWTAEQKNVIDLNGGNILVSASAGSGKTTVMVKKITDLLLKPVPIENVLVLSYTVESAADMRAKIVGALFDCAKAADGGDDEIKIQIDNIPFSDISTIDGFCAKLIKENFEELGVDSSFSVVDGEEEKILKKRVMHGLLRDKRMADDIVFGRLAERFSKIADDTALPDILIKLYESVYIHADPLNFERRIKEVAKSGGINENYAEIALNSFADAGDEYAFAFDKIKRLFPADMDKSAKEWCASVDGRINILRSLRPEKGESAIEKLVGASSVAADTPTKTAKISKYLKENFGDLSDAIDRINAESKAKKSAVDGLSSSLGEITAACGGGKPPDYVLNTEKIISGLIGLVEEFRKKYSDYKRSVKKLDFQDLSRLSLKLLSDDKKAAEIRGAFSYVFVDEYQDINPLQEAILRRVASDDNLFMVGDSKQSIYAFRNADAQIFLDKFADYSRSPEHGTALMLTQNFRSNKSILAFADELFSELMNGTLSDEVYNPNNLFISENTKTTDNLLEEGVVDVEFFALPDGKETVEIEPEIYSVKKHRSDDTEETRADYYEGARIAEKIKSLVGKRRIVSHGNGTATSETVKYSDIVILLRSRSAGAKELIRALKDNSVPYVTDNFEGDVGKNVRKTLLNLVRVIDNSYDDISFAGYLLSYFGGFDEDDLAEVRLRNPDRLPVVDAVKKISSDVGDLSAKCKKALTRLDGWRFCASYKDVSELLSDIISETAFDAAVLARPSGKAELRYVHSFLSSVKNADYARTPAAFLSYFDNAEKERAFDLRSDFGDVVRVMTVHGSKGLEFPVVFLAQTQKCTQTEKSDDISIDKDLGVGTKFFESETLDKSESLAMTAIKIKKSKESAAELARLLYVAVTRAKNMLFVSGTMKRGSYSGALAFGGSLADKKSFADLILYAASKNADLALKCKLSDVERVEKPVRNALPPVVFNAPEKVYADAVRDTVAFVYPYESSTKLSPKYTVTELNNSDDGGDYSYVPHLYSIDARERGVAYHAVMENIDFNARTLSEVEASIAKAVENGVLTEEQAKLVNGEEILACITQPLIKKGLSGKCFKEQSFMLKIAANEVMDTDSTDEILVQGTIDLLFLGEENVVVDYKNSALVSNDLKEKYKKQLKIYVIAAEKCLNVKIHRQYLYSFSEKKLIEL